MRQHPLAPVSALATFALATLALAVPATTRAQDRTPYTLTPSSDLGYGCAPPCMCAFFYRGPLTGGFTLKLTSMDLLYAHYALLDFAWRWEVPDGNGGTRIETVTGHGTLDMGGGGVGNQRLQLELTTEDGFAHHFDSGRVRVPPGEALDFEVPMGHVCRDSVLRFVALPQTGVRLAAAPNPARAGADIVLVLPEQGAGRVEVVSVSGQIVAVIANGAFPAGESRWRWDGRNAAGADAGVGVFWVRARVSYDPGHMTTIGGPQGATLTHQFVRLR